MRQVVELHMITAEELLSKLKRKYGGTIENVLENLKKFEDRVNKYFLVNLDI